MPFASYFQSIFAYPEFIIAAILGIVMLRSNRESESEGLPSWFTQPATTIMGAMPNGYLKWLHKRQVWAGWRTNSAFGALAAGKIYIPLLMVIAGLIAPLWVVPLLMVLTFFIPDLLVTAMSSRRKQKIKESLPQALDLMVLCVDAGLGLDATLQRIATESSVVNQELNDELLILSRDILLGMEREKAYVELFERTGVDELKSLGASLNQSSKLGISVSRILRGQAEFLRNKLGQKAEEKAAKLPIYMAFPLWLCIMPALLVVVLAPSFITFFEQVRPLMFR